MTKLACLRAAAACACLTILFAAAARAEDSAAPAAKPATKEAIQQAIDHERARRNGAIAGMVVGGAALIGGAIDSDVAQVQNHNESDNGQPHTHNPYVGYAVGLGVGLPILGISSYVFADSLHQLNVLRHEQLSVSYSPDSHRPLLQLSFSY
jgi:hypothetical protein